MHVGVYVHTLIHVYMHVYVCTEARGQSQELEMVQLVKCWLYKHGNPSWVLSTYTFKRARCVDIHLIISVLGRQGQVHSLDREPSLIGNSRSQ